MLEDVNATVARELARYPRGAHGSGQNLFRAVYQMERAASLGRKQLGSMSAAEVVERAVSQVRQEHPGFVPETV